MDTNTVKSFTTDTVTMLTKANDDGYMAVAHAAVEGRDWKGRELKEAIRAVANIKMANGAIEAAHAAAKQVGADYAFIVQAMRKAAAEKAEKAKTAYAARKAEKAKKEREEKEAAEKAEQAEKAKTERQKVEEIRADAQRKIDALMAIIATCDKRIAELDKAAEDAARANLQAASAVQNPTPALTDAIDAAQAELAKQAGAVTDTADIESTFKAQREAVHAKKRAKAEAERLAIPA